MSERYRGRIPCVAGWLQRVDRRVGRDVGRVDEQLLAPDQPRRDALLGDRREEALDDHHPVAFPETGQAGMLGQRLGRVVAEGPTAG